MVVPVGGDLPVETPQSSLPLTLQRLVSLMHMGTSPFCRWPEAGFSQRQRPAGVRGVWALSGSSQAEAGVQYAAKDIG